MNCIFFCGFRSRWDTKLTCISFSKVSEDLRWRINEVKLIPNWRYNKQQQKFAWNFYYYYQHKEQRSWHSGQHINAINPRVKKSKQHWLGTEKISNVKKGVNSRLKCTHVFRLHDSLMERVPNSTWILDKSTCKLVPSTTIQREASAIYNWRVTSHSIWLIRIWDYVVERMYRVCIYFEMYWSAPIKQRWWRFNWLMKAWI